MKETRDQLSVNNKKKKHIGLQVGLTLLAVAVVAVVIYVLTPYKASDAVAMYFDEEQLQYVVEENDELQKVTLTEIENRLIVATPEKSIAGLIFYPGGRVEYDAYVPLMYAFAQRGITCVLVDMPFNFAVFDIKAADGIKDMFPEVENWYIGGHSLGGAMASVYVKDHSDEFEGVLLLGAYTTEDLSDTELKVFLAYGTQDGVINRNQYARNLKNLPEGSSELIVVGGCHSYFGDYGNQRGDGHPYITRSEQMNATADAFVEYIFGNEVK